MTPERVDDKRLKELVSAMEMRSNHETFANERHFCREVLSALRELQEARKDAQRYRMIRSRHHEGLGGEHLDAAIDAELDHDRRRNKSRA